MPSATRTVILAFASVFTPLVALGQGKSELRGRVVRESGETIAGATITLASGRIFIRLDVTNPQRRAHLLEMTMTELSLGRNSAG